MYGSSPNTPTSTDCEIISHLWSWIETEFPNIFSEPLSNNDKELGCMDKDDEYFIEKNLLLLLVRLYVY